MEAHHFRPDGLDYRAICVIEWDPICRSPLHLEIDTELDIVWFQLLAPLAIDNRVIAYRSMAEEIHVDGRGSSRPELDQRFRKLSWRHLRGRQGSKSTCNSNRDSHLRRAGSRHRRLNDRVLDVEKLLDPIIGPMRHGLPFRNRRTCAGGNYSCHGKRYKPRAHSFAMPTSLVSGTWAEAAIRFRYSSTGRPPHPQFSTSTSSMTTNVEFMGLFRTSRRSLLTPPITCAFRLRVTPG